ncbi:MAG: GTP-binding protein [Candidatus Helarchaeota archaeon]
MVRIKNFESMLKLMYNVNSIRNIGIIAHIDHGKTTLSDILLSKSGVISKSIAGDARVLDYLNEEQKRGITIKSANISLFYDNYIINLVDTPGHVDFSGKVVRALRIIDGVIVVVDAVEGCMVQTEILTTQALQELVKPILFINKIDRLIKELKLSEDKIQKRLDYIIQTFNKILKNNLPHEIYEKWEIRPHRNNVIFGSALHHWGFTFDQMIQSGKRFSSIIEIYENSSDVLSIRNIGYNLFPLDDAILKSIIENTPDPQTAQKYRIPEIWKGDINSNLGRDLTNCNKSGITLIGINKIISDIHIGRIAIGRIFSGTIKIGANLFLLNNNEPFRLLNLYIFMGPNKQIIKELPAGNIIAITGNKNISIGETLIDFKHKDEGVPFEKLQYTQNPVITVSIEPYHPRELKKMIDILKEIDQEDPNLEVIIKEETGEYLISGMGELHLEIITKLIEDQGVKVITTKPMVIYVESIKKKSKMLTFTSNDHSFFLKFQILPIDPQTLNLFHLGTLHSDLPLNDLSKILANNANWNESEANSIISIIEKNNIIINKCENDFHLNDKFSDQYIFMTKLFEMILKKGPVIGEKIFGLKIVIYEYIIQESLLNLDPIMIVNEFKDCFYTGFKNSSPTVLEPIYKIQITTPIKYIGKCTSIIESRRGKIEQVSTNNSHSIITGFIPVSESFNLSDEMRSKTSGWAFWQTVFSHWAVIPDEKINSLVDLI